MKRDEILAMTSGQELDELVAIKVMGREDNKTVWGRKPFEPSRSISAAWEVFEEALKGVSNGYITDAIEGFACGLVDKPASEDEPCKVYDAVGKTAPEAICKAALLAVMDI